MKLEYLYNALAVVIMFIVAALFVYAIVENVIGKQFLP